MGKHQLTSRKHFPLRQSVYSTVTESERKKGGCGGRCPSSSYSSRFRSRQLTSCFLKQTSDFGSRTLRNEPRRQEKRSWASSREAQFRRPKTLAGGHHVHRKACHHQERRYVPRHAEGGRRNRHRR